MPISSVMATTGLQSLEGVAYVVFGFFGIASLAGGLGAFLIARRQKLGVRILWALGAATVVPVGALVFLFLLDTL